jgi:hypothetical protein
MGGPRRRSVPTVTRPREPAASECRSRVPGGRRRSSWYPPRLRAWHDTPGTDAARAASGPRSAPSRFVRAPRTGSDSKPRQYPPCTALIPRPEDGIQYRPLLERKGVNSSNDNSDAGLSQRAPGPTPPRVIRSRPERRAGARFRCRLSIGRWSSRAPTAPSLVDRLPGEHPLGELDGKAVPSPRSPASPRRAVQAPRCSSPTRGRPAPSWSSRTSCGAPARTPDPSRATSRRFSGWRTGASPRS